MVLADLVEKINWAINNHAACEQIAAASTEFIKPLWYNPSHELDLQKALLRRFLHEVHDREFPSGKVAPPDERSDLHQRLGKHDREQVVR